MKKFILFSGLLILLFIGCDDMEPNTDHLDCHNPIYPIMTTSGVNKLACKVNGKIWVSCTPAFALFDPPFRMGYDSVTGHFGINSWWITSDKSIDEKIGLEAYIKGGTTGVYKLINVKNASNFLDVDNNFKSYHIDTTLPNFLKISMHERNKEIISGTFEFIAINLDNIKDTIRVTEGQFDGKY